MNRKRKNNNPPKKVYKSRITAKLEKAAPIWIQRLGLTSWEFAVAVADEDTMRDAMKGSSLGENHDDSYTPYGLTLLTDEHNFAQIYINMECVPFSRTGKNREWRFWNDLEWILVHELGHVFLRNATGKCNTMKIQFEEKIVNSLATNLIRSHGRVIE